MKSVMITTSSSGVNDAMMTSGGSRRRRGPCARAEDAARRPIVREGRQESTNERTLQATEQQTRRTDECTLSREEKVYPPNDGRRIDSSAARAG
eukprot:28401-Pelagococcus_subviridis.AAC.13